MPNLDLTRQRHLVLSTNTPPQPYLQSFLKQGNRLFPFPIPICLQTLTEDFDQRLFLGVAAPAAEQFVNGHRFVFAFDSDRGVSYVPAWAKWAE
ncbi:MAG: hypothetical protein GY801_20090 [bacterium]|nr:hypothetical protein [bacterium]